ncbi:RNA recognition motif [Geosmithia morbida]|uniref:RNA recognition motif n=1 Tax=Geosmithia morbida TaxID=1094350 RepID=A0A9P4YTC0_9HYPO|nr:RNA recognition motif [Geosmithia morbida]KAF4122736.1 RNA recognition motif [Geosmithia morbida]
MSNSTVHVTNIAPATGDDEVKDFFSFCGKISDLSITAEGETKSANVTFEKETAAKTALLLNNTQLGTNHISVSSASGSPGEDTVVTNADRDTDEITQEEKPRARILAEYLAHGYVVGDAAIQRALELDHQHGVSKRFLSTLQSFDSKYHASDRARATDQSYGISQRANSLLSGLSSYFEKASSTPTGKKIVQFYSDSQKQVQEVHAEAKRLAELKKQEHGGSAYKASGLGRFLGKDKDGNSTGTDEKSTGAAAGAPAAVGTATGAPSSTTGEAATPPVVDPSTEKPAAS